jgi:putative sigma-54 modulation protein
MKFQITGKNVEVTESLTSKVNAKLEGIAKYLKINQEIEARVVLSVDSFKDKKIEVTIPTKVAIFRAEAKDKDMYVAIDVVYTKLISQLQRMKTRLSRKNNRVKFSKAFEIEQIQQEESQRESVVVKTKSIDVGSLDVEEAASQMDLLGHNFFIYKDSDSNKFSVLYRRDDGQLGLIEINNSK